MLHVDVFSSMMQVNYHMIIQGNNVINKIVAYVDAIINDDLNSSTPNGTLYSTTPGGWYSSIA